MRSPSRFTIPKNLADKQILGQAGEDAALQYLMRQGLVLVERNFRCKQGEIDLIMQERGDLIFVEVRKRAYIHYGGAAASVTPAKRARLISAAKLYLQRYKTIPACRFDVVAIDDGAISWLKNAIETIES